MAPVLSLDYSSQSGDGIVGYGWSLSGLPTIDRCPRTLAQDTVHGGVNYDNNDRFCMEGKRLVATTGSSYGAGGTEYRTELETYSRIISYGSAGNGPSYFRVWTKSGQIMEFGYTSDSRILAVGKSTVRVWALDKLSDAKGNYLAVSYTNDTTNGQFYPARVDYTGNSGAGLSTYNSVRFDYSTTRADVSISYHAGSLVKTTALLKNIKTYQANNLMSDYQLGYRDGTSTTHSRLTSVTLCDASGNCLAPTTFGWQGGTGQLTMSGTASSLVPGYNKLFSFSGDLNGDGLVDFVAPERSACGEQAAYLGTQSGNFTATMLSDGNCNSNPPSPLDEMFGPAADFNGDGLTDFVINYLQYNTNEDGMYLQNVWMNMLLNSGTGALTPTNGGFFITSTSVFGDFNGDGRTDIFFPHATANNYYEYFNTDGTFSLSYSSYKLSTPVRVGDFDGDGCIDVFNDSQLFYNCSPATSSAAVPSLTGKVVTPGDFNGDGKTDLLVTELDSEGNPIAGALYLSTGTGFTDALPIPSDWGKYAIVTGDWNGDGKTDVLLVAPGGTNMYGLGTSHQLWLSTGTGFVPAVDQNNAVITIANINGSDTRDVIAASADWNNDGATDFWLEKPSGNIRYTFSHVPELMTSVSNGIGAATTITYDRLNKNGSFYQKCSNGTYVCNDPYPIQNIDGAFYAVSRVDQSNGVGGTYATSYAYAGAKSDIRGRGFLGFAKVTATDLQTNIVTTTNYRQDFPFTGMVSTRTKTSGSVTLSSVTNNYTDNNLGTGTDGVVRYFVSLTQSAVAANDLDGTALPTTTTTYGNYDSYGNASTVNVSVSDGSSKNTTSTYSNVIDASKWFLGRLTSTVVTSSVGSSSITRTSCYQYDPNYGLLSREVVEPVSTTNCAYSSTGAQTDYSYDPFGNRTGTTISGPDITSRSTSAGYSPLGQFQTSATNALSQSESWTHDARFGLPMSHTDLNGLTTTWDYDTFGRMWRESRPDGNKTVYSYAYCSGSCVTYGATFATATPQNAGGSQNGPQTIAYYDALNRSLASDTQGFDGSSWIRSSIQYDANGRVWQTSRPYFVSGGTPKWTINTYDALGRVTQASLPNGGSASYAYHGLTSSVTNDHGQTTTTVGNAQGLNATITDALNHMTYYVYDAFGNLKTITDPAGNVTTNLYDVRGNKTDSYDPDKGHWHYGYDALGELTSQTDAKSQATTLGYDLLGRLTSRSENGQVSSWEYGTATPEIGRLKRAKACTSAGCGTVISDRTFTYDAQSRPYTSVTTVDGNVNAYTSTYDSNGRPATLTYPSGLALQYVYTGLGYLSQIKDNGSGTAYWTANGRDAEMHLAGQTFGNGVVLANTYFPATGLLQYVRATKTVFGDTAQLDFDYDTLGNLTSRADSLNGVFEFDCYDPLNRLHQYGVGHGTASATCTTATINKVVEYDDQGLGNIKSKTDVGGYTYNPARPHAVASVTGTVNGVANPSYTYDDNGNMTVGAGRTVTYTAFNMAASISQGSGTTSAGFVYDDLHQRIKQTLVKGSTTTVTTYLNDAASGAMSEKVVTGSAVTWREYLLVDGHIFAQHTSTSGGSSGPMWGTATWNAFNWASAAAPAPSWQYFILDHLSSVAAVTDQTGALVETNSYDAWGKRRTFTDGSDDTAGSIRSQTTRGFTGHEQIDDIGLINMNARVYDPQLGRFMSADPITPSLYNLQSLNRYTYADNGPLSLTDPTGAGPTSSDSCNASGCSHWDNFGGGTYPTIYIPFGTTISFEMGSRGFGSLNGVNATLALGGGANGSTIIAAGPSASGLPATGSSTNANLAAAAAQSEVTQKSKPVYITNGKTTDRFGTNNGGVTVIMGYKPITGAPIADHSYVKIVGPGGQEFYIRGGPSGDNANGSASPLSADALDSQYASDGSYGKLVTSSGYDALQIEASQKDDVSKVLGKVNMTFDQAMNKLLTFGRSVDAAKIDYWPLSANSNAFSHQAVTVLGLPRPPEAGDPVWTPGADWALPVNH